MRYHQASGLRRMWGLQPSETQSYQGVNPLIIHNIPGRFYDYACAVPLASGQFRRLAEV